MIHRWGLCALLMLPIPWRDADMSNTQSQLTAKKSKQTGGRTGGVFSWEKADMLWTQRELGFGCVFVRVSNVCPWVG